MRSVAAERREELAAAAHVEAAGASAAIGGANIDANQGELFVAPLRFVHRAGGFGVRNILGLGCGQRLGRARNLILKRVLLVAQIAHLTAEFVVLAL